MGVLCVCVGLQGTPSVAPFDGQQLEPLTSGCAIFGCDTHPHVEAARYHGATLAGAVLSSKLRRP